MTSAFPLLGSIGLCNHFPSGGWFGSSVTAQATYAAIPVAAGSAVYYTQSQAGCGEWSPGAECVACDASGSLVVPKGRNLKLPDGSVLHVDDSGNYRLDDANAKVIYQANRMREFNPYVNASDLLAAFIRYLGGLGLTRLDAGHIPIVLFVHWLVIEAATVDGDPIPADVVPPAMHPLFQQVRDQLAAQQVA